MQEIAAQLAGSERVAHCCRTLTGSQAQIIYNRAEGSARYAGVQTCGSVWMCPVCACKISEGRRQELRQGVEEWVRRGGQVLLITYTIRHKRGDDLKSNVDGLMKARREARSGRWSQEFNGRHGVVGSVRALEVTHGQNGWHPHLHELMFVRGDVDPHEVEAQLRQRWAEMVDGVGLREVNEHGVNVQATREDHLTIAEYIAKFGRNRSWGEAEELAKAVRKKGRDGSRTPVCLLLDYAAGDEQAGWLWCQYAKVFKGRRQLVWSRGLRELLGLKQEKSDQELAEEEGKGGELLVELGSGEWRVVVEEQFRGFLLGVARLGDAALVRSVVRALIEKRKRRDRRARGDG